MKYQNELQSALREIAESPKVYGAVSATTATAGLASYADMFRGTISVVAVLAGLIATGILALVHWIKYRNERITNLILRKQAEDLGIDISKED